MTTPPDPTTGEVPAPEHQCGSIDPCNSTFACKRPRGHPDAHLDLKGYPWPQRADESPTALGREIANGETQPMASEETVPDLLAVLRAVQSAAANHQFCAGMCPHDLLDCSGDAIQEFIAEALAAHTTPS